MTRMILFSVISMPVIVLAIVGAIFLINPPTPEPVTAPAPAVSLKEKRIKIKAHALKSFRDKRWSDIRHTMDSLFTVIDLLNDSLKRKNSAIDSLQQKMAFYQSDYQNLEQEIEKLKAKITSSKAQTKKIKDLAKTLSGLKGKSLAKIVARMDDKTIIQIYEQMSTTSKKTLLASLPANRAAAIAQKMLKN